MPLPSSNNPIELLAAVEESARRGDWRTAGDLVGKLGQVPVPTGRAELGLYLECLQKAIVAARSSRAHAIASLRRVNAAAGFCRTRVIAAAERQDFVESPEL